jgi:hypothetical protein
MVSDDQIKNITTNLSVVLRELFSSVFSGKTVSKVNSLLDDETTKTLLAEFVKTHMTVTEKKTTKKSKKSNKTKKKKDPNAPKKNCSSYIFFCKDTRSTVKEDNSEFKGTEITKELGRLWRELDDEQKLPFVEQADLDKVRYQEEMKTYTPSVEASEEESDGKKPKKTRKPGPKKASSSYLFFCKEQRSKTKVSHPEMDAKDITRKLRRMWKEDMTDKKKKKFEKLAAQDKARYDEEKEGLIDKVIEIVSELNSTDDDNSDLETKVKKTKKTKSSDDSSDSETNTKSDSSDSETNTKSDSSNSETNTKKTKKTKKTK